MRMGPGRGRIELSSSSTVDAPKFDTDHEERRDGPAS